MILPRNSGGRNQPAKNLLIGWKPFIGAGFRMAAIPFPAAAMSHCNTNAL
jgi:hypothetical protein